MEPTTATDLALLILRCVIGLTMAAHGWNKFTGGGKIPGTGRWFDSIGMRPGRLNAYLAASSEVGAGLLLAVGDQSLQLHRGHDWPILLAAELLPSPRPLAAP